jgi:hypothetical protein
MAKDRTDGRRESRAARREAEERRRQRNSTRLIAAGVLLVLGVAAYVYYKHVKDQLLAAVVTTTYPAGQHVAGPITYRENPPMGGPHNVVWQNCGSYDFPIHNEHAVHALEHGAVWITYRPDLPSDQVQHLKDVAAEDYMLLSPYPGLKSAVVASAWNHQIALDGATDPRLPAFIGRYKNNPDTTPELGASCAGGTSAPATADSLNTLATLPAPMPR